MTFTEEMVTLTRRASAWLRYRRPVVQIATELADREIRMSDVPVTAWQRRQSIRHHIVDVNLLLQTIAGVTHEVRYFSRAYSDDMIEPKAVSYLFGGWVTGTEPSLDCLMEMLRRAQDESDLYRRNAATAAFKRSSPAPNQKSSNRDISPDGQVMISIGSRRVPTTRCCLVLANWIDEILVPLLNELIERELRHRN